MSQYFSNIIKLIRPKHYIKNIFIFAPLFFAGKISNQELLINAFIAFVSFSMAASSIYILNDLLDINQDRLHPKKKHRPLAANLISKQLAISLFVLFLVLSVSVMYFLSSNACLILLFYVTLNIAYSFKLKQIAILDVMIIAIGFVFRLFVGSMSTDIPLSTWIVLMTFLLALFLALAKRRDDVLLFLETGKKMRKVIDGYSLKLIDASMVIMSSVVIVSYIMFTTSAEALNRMHNENLYLTTIFVILGILRYMQIVFIEENSSSPTQVILKDRSLQLTIIAWLASFVWIIYL